MPLTVAYLMSRFPKLTETFILFEILTLEELGLRVEIFPLLKQREATWHAGAAPLVARAHYASPFAAAVWRAQLYWLRRRPRRLFAIWREIWWGSRRSLKFLARGLAAGLFGAHFARQMIELEIDHIHAHWATHPALAALVAHRLTGIPYSFTAHAHDIYVNQTLLPPKLREAAFVVTISDYNRRFLQERFGNELSSPIHVIRCGVDIDLFKPRPAGSAAADRPEDRPFTLVCLGRLEEKKGQRYLIEACRLLDNDHQNIRCLLIGDGPERDALASQVRRAGLESMITLVGQQPQAEVRRLLAESDLMVMPSVRLANGKQEGIPVALMEGLALGLPAVASALSGIPELIEDGRTGLLVPERDPAALAAAIARLIKDRPLGRRLGAAGRQKILNEYNLQRNTAEIAHLFRQSAGSPIDRDPSSTPVLAREEDCR